MAALAVIGTVVGVVLRSGEGSATTGIGDTLAGEVGPGERDQYTFNAAEGQRIFLVNGGNPATGTCEGLDNLSWSLRPEDGQSPLFDEEMNDCSYPSGPEGYDLSADTYVLAIRNDGGDGNGLRALPPAIWSTSSLRPASPSLALR